MTRYQRQSQAISWHHVDRYFTSERPIPHLPVDLFLLISLSAALPTLFLSLSLPLFSGLTPSAATLSATPRSTGRTASSHADILQRQRRSLRRRASGRRRRSVSGSLGFSVPSSGLEHPGGAGDGGALHHVSRSCGMRGVGACVRGGRG